MSHPARFKRLSHAILEVVDRIMKSKAKHHRKGSGGAVELSPPPLQPLGTTAV
jgi:hypothetical protein